MCLRHRDGRVWVDQFEPSGEFVAALRALNPDVPVTGLWPQGPP
jgi:hypothetical protein